jgi:hypothetical protein
LRATQTIPAGISSTAAAGFALGNFLVGGTRNVASDSYDITIGLLQNWTWKFADTHPGTSRHWMGFASGMLDSGDGSSVLTDSWKSDGQNGDLIGFALLPDVSSNWKAYYGGIGLGSDNFLDTGIAIDASYHTYSIKISGGNILWLIDGVQRASVAIPAYYQGTSFAATASGGTFRSVFFWDNWWSGGVGAQQNNFISLHYELSA